MSDILAFLDRVIDELQPVAPVPEVGAGASNPLTEQRLPVVPVTRQDIYELDAQIEKKTGCEIWQRECRPQEYLSKSTGSTGSTGSSEAFCGQNTSRVNDSHGKLEAVTGSREGLCDKTRGKDPVNTCETHTTTAERPLLMPDGRRLHRFRADDIQVAVPNHVQDLIDQARWHGVVLVADGQELIVVERRHRVLPYEVLDALQGDAGAIIAALSGESRARLSPSTVPQQTSR
jgi:hypothetical protein